MPTGASAVSRSPSAGKSRIRRRGPGATVAGKISGALLVQMRRQVVGVDRRDVEVRVDRAIQVHGGAGVSDDFPLAAMYAHARTLRIADGPDEVHLMTVARRELRRCEASAR